MLTVLSIAYPLAPVGFDTAGGSEQILALLDRALTERGHRSIVVGCEGSRVHGELVATPRRRAFFTEAGRAEIYPPYRAAIHRALREHEVDVIHFHGIDVHRYLPLAGPPALITLHLPPAWYSPQIFKLDRLQTYLNCVSRSQEQACPPGARLLPFVGNGVPVERFHLASMKRDFAIVLARICPEKGIHLALDAAALARIPLLIGGEVFPYEAHRHYFKEQVVPRLSQSRRFLGPQDFRRKRRLLAAAKCLLAPNLAPETSSLVAMEALASGTPVIAFRSGALEEIVEDGVTGFLVSDAQEMAEAIKAVNSIDSLRCRRAAEERFPAARMVRGYFDLYAAIARQSQEIARGHFAEPRPSRQAFPPEDASRRTV